MTRWQANISRRHLLALAGTAAAASRVAGCMPAGVFNGSVQGLPWHRVHAMPRVLTLEGDHLRQDPLPEFETLRGKVHSLENTRGTPEVSGYIKVRGDALEIRAEFENQGASRFGVKVRDARAAEGDMNLWSKYQGPQPFGYTEQVYLADLLSDRTGMTEVLLESPDACGGRSDP